MASTYRQVTCSFSGPDDPDITVDNARSLDDLKLAIAQQTGKEASLMIILNNANGAQLTNGVLPAGLSEVTIIEMNDMLPGMSDTDEFRDMLFAHDDCVRSTQYTVRRPVRHGEPFKSSNMLGSWLSMCLYTSSDVRNRVYSCAHITKYSDRPNFSWETVWYKESPRYHCLDQNMCFVKKDKYDLLVDLIQAYRVVISESPHTYYDDSTIAAAFAAAAAAGDGDVKREISVCSRCNKTHQIMPGVDYCIGCVLTGLQ